jgi:hypothetical protein
VAGHQLIGAAAADYLARLARELPADAVDELADGLAECWRHHRERGLSADAATRAAVAEFGTVDEVTAAFVARSPGRRTARLLLATGPLVGGCWAVGLVLTRFWTWPVPGLAVAVYGTCLLLVVAALVVAATSRRNYRRARLGTLAGLALLPLDATMLVTVALLAPAPGWPVAVAAATSLTRITLTLGLRLRTRSLAT